MQFIISGMAIVDSDSGSGKDWRQMILGSHAALNEPELAQALIDAVAPNDKVGQTFAEKVGEVSSGTAQVSGFGQLSDPSSPAAPAPKE